MKITDILEKDKERLLTELTEAKRADRAVRVLENELDKLLLRHNEQAGSDKERDAAAYMMQAVRLSLPLIDSAGKVRVWEHDGGSSKSASADKSSGKGGVIPVLMMMAGIVLCLFGLIPLVLVNLSAAGKSAQMDIITRGAAVLAGAILMFAAGMLYSRPKEGRKKEQHVEISVDPNKIYRSFRAAMISVDQSLDEVRSAERWSKREKAGTIEGRPATTPEIELFADLLAASYSGDPEYALEKIDAIKYYLHRQQIEVVDYSSETSRYFDLMPGSRAGTIRPALVADGALLKKGLASTGR